MSKFDVERWLAIRKEAGLTIDPETAEVCWNMRRLGTPTASIQICLRNVGKLAAHTSLGAREVTYGSTSGTYQMKPVTPFGKNINPNWRSLLD